MTYAEFEEHWADAAEAERARFDAMPVADLLDRVEKRRLGDYYTIWGALGDRATLEEAGWILFRVLESRLDYLHKHHCAAALLKLIGMDRAPDQAVRYSGRDAYDVTRNLQRLREIIATRIGEERATDNPA